nr:hypothetical protein [Tanacetum cinerariifolium]
GPMGLESCAMWDLHRVTWGGRAKGVGTVQVRWDVRECYVGVMGKKGGKEQIDGEAMINSIKNGDQPLPRLTQVSIAETSSTEQPPLKDKSMCKTAKDLWDALARHMLGSKYGEQDKKAAVLYEYETFKATEGELLLDTYIRYLQYATMMRQNKNLMNINIDALYNILKKNQGDVNDAMGSKKKTVVVASDPLALIAEKTNVSRSKEKVVVSSKSEGSEADDFSELKKITALLAKAFNRRKFFSKPTNNNLRTSSTSQSKEKVVVSSKSEGSEADDFSELKKITALLAKKDDKKKRDMSKVKCYNYKKEGHFAKDCKKVKVKDYEYYKTKMLLAKKDKDEQVLLAEDQAYNLYNGRKGIGFENPSYFEKAKDLRPTLYDEKVIGLRYTSMFLTHSDEALEIEKFKRSRENKIEFAYDYGNRNASYQTSSLKPYVPNVILEKIIIDLKDEVVNLLEKEKVNLETIESLRSKGFDSSETVISESENQSENDCLVVENECDKQENSKVIAPGMFKLSVSQSVSSISMSKTSCKSNNVDRETSSDSVCNDAMNVFCNPRTCDLLDDNNLFIFDDESVKISPVSKMPFRKKPCDSMNVRSKSNMIKSLPRTFLGTVRFGNNDFAMIAVYGDVVIGSMTIKKVYYVEGLGHNLFSVGQFCDKGLEVAFQKSTCFVRNEDGVDLLTACKQGKIHRKHHKSKTAFASNKPLYLFHMDLCGPMCVQIINGKQYVLVVVDDYSWYTWRVRTDNGTEFKNKTLAKFLNEVGITQHFSAVRTPQQNGVVERRNRTLVEAARTMLTFANLPSFLWAEAIATTCFTQNRLIIHKRFEKTPYELMNKRKPNIKFFCVFGCRCYLLNDYEDVGKLKEKGILEFLLDIQKNLLLLEFTTNELVRYTRA